MRINKPFRTAAIFLSAISYTHAATYQWDTNSSTAGLGAAGGATASWSGTNWDLIGGTDDGTAVTTAHGFTAGTDVALFGGTAGTVTVDQAIVPRTLQFASDGYTLATNNNLGSGNLTFNIGGSFTQRAVTVTGTNASFSGGVNIQGIDLTVDSLSTLGNTGNIKVGTDQSSRRGSLIFTELGSAVSTNRISVAFSGANPTSLPVAQTIKNNSATANTLTLTNNFGPNGLTNSVTILGLGGSNIGNNTVSGIISNGTSNTMGLSKVDAGTWVLTGTNTYGGNSTGTTVHALGTTIAAGKLITGNNSALGVGNVNVSTTGATLQVGNGTVNSLTLGSAATLGFAADATLKLGASTSQIIMNGGTFSFGDGVNIDITGLSLGAGNYILVDGNTAGSMIGAWNQSTDLIGGNTGLFSYNFSLVGNDAVLNVAAVPEPGAALLGGLGVLALLRRRRTA